jgi:hypothetical protein
VSDFLDNPLVELTDTSKTNGIIASDSQGLKLIASAITNSGKEIGLIFLLLSILSESKPNPKINKENISPSRVI